jgi:hypothetical protein
MLDLVAEVAAGHVEERTPFDVRRANELAYVPGPPAPVLDLLLAECVGLVREVAAEDDRMAHRLRTTLAVTSAHSAAR